MKYSLLNTMAWFVFIAIRHDCVGQPNISGNYLLVRFNQQFDHTNQRYYFTLNAEEGCDSAREVYTLLTYDYKKKAINKEGIFYFANKSLSDSLYNYFLTQTEGINYLSKNRWALHSIFTETFSGYDNQRTGAGEIVPVTTVSSRPVFCFIK